MLLSFDEIAVRNFTNITDEYLNFAKAKNECRSCNIFSAYETVVMSEGNVKNPTFMFIGECPGQTEVEEHRPFIGKAGQRLRSELRKYKDVFNKSSALISNVIPCRPLNNKFPSNDNNWMVKKCCNNWLYNEILLVKPKVIVILGNPALKAVRNDWGITKNRGEWKFLPQFQAWTLATFHPSYVMRCSCDSDKQHIEDQFESDIKKVAIGWSSIISADHRMSMNADEWNKYKMNTCDKKL